MRNLRRLLPVVLLVGLLLSGSGAAWLQHGEDAEAAIDSPGLEVPVPTTTTTTTVLPSTTSVPSTVTAPPVRRSRPVDVPSNPYAPEPIVQIGTIDIPKIGLSHPIFEGISLRSIDQGPSHWPGTALPGERGNAVFAGHRVTHTHPFLNIDKLVEGDQVIFTVRGTRSAYVVTGHEIVTPKELRIVEQTAMPTATIFGCHPPHSAKFRYVVHLALANEGQ